MVDQCVIDDMMKDMIQDMDHEREMLVWFIGQKRCIPIRHELWDLSNQVVSWLLNPTITDYPKLCSQTADLSEIAWLYVHGYLPPRDEKRGAA